MADKATYGDEASQSSEANESWAGFTAKKGSVFPTKKKSVKTMMAEKIASSFSLTKRIKNDNTTIKAGKDADT